MNIKRIGVAAIATIAFSLAGCMPTLLTSQPKAKIFVTENSGAPLPGATITLGTVENHGIVGRLTRQEFLTDKDGKVAIRSKHKWAIQILLPDGDVSYWWTLCVSKPGFHAVAVTKPEFERPIHLALIASPTRSECSWPKYRMMPEVAEWKPGQWIEVEGGVWTPDGATMIAISDSIQATAQSSAQGYRRELNPWSEYLFQYQGRMSGTTPWVYIRALCRTPADFDLRKAFYAGPADPCSFSITYDAKRGRFDSFEMNAVTQYSPSR